MPALPGLWVRSPRSGMSLYCLDRDRGPAASGWLRMLVVEGWLNRLLCVQGVVFSQVSAVSRVSCRRPVKPSAQPTLVRTQHLPPRKTPGQGVDRVCSIRKVPVKRRKFVYTAARGRFRRSEPWAWLRA